MRIQYAIDTQTGLVVSCVGNELAWPILEYDEMRIENNYSMSYHLEKLDIFSIETHMLKWTRKIPKEIKNVHRDFWGFSKLK